MGKYQVVVTGANGFIGHELCCQLWARGYRVLAVARNASRENAQAVALGDIGPATDWANVLDGAECVIHCAARAHVLQETATDPLAAFRAVNVDGTRRLAEQAAAMGVSRLVFLSSIGVLGNNTNNRQPFTGLDVPAPIGPYAVSKLEAEQVLREIAASSDLEVVMVRPPLVYGPGVRGNFLRLIQLVARGIPLPFGSVDNRRSLVALDNLVEVLVRCVEHASAADRTFLVSDGEDLSTPELIRRIAGAMGTAPRMVSVPPKALSVGARLVGRSVELARLTGSLQVDIDYTCRTLNWSPCLTVDQGLRRAVAGV